MSDATNTITFTCNGTPCAHNATTGDAVTYQNLGNGTIPGLTNGRTYSVIVTGPNSVQLGGTFTSNDVNTALDVIDFGLRDPHLETGDHVIYFRIGSASTIGGLTNGVEYEVYRVPGTNRIKLRPLGFSSASTSRNAGSVDNGTEFITGAAPFANGDFVTYYAPDPLATFSSVQVGKRFTFSGGDVNGTTASANTIYFTVDSNNNGKLDNGDSIGLSTGDRIFYTASDPLNAIGGLTSGVFYFVIRLDGLDYQLADTKCHATGAAGDCGGSAQPQQVLTLTLSAANQTTAGKQVVHAIRAATNAPIAGLDGRPRLLRRRLHGRERELQQRHGLPALELPGRRCDQHRQPRRHRWAASVLARGHQPHEHRHRPGQLGSRARARAQHRALVGDSEAPRHRRRGSVRGVDRRPGRLRVCDRRRRRADQRLRREVVLQRLQRPSRPRSTATRPSRPGRTSR